MDHHNTLGVSKSANKAEIQDAFRRAAKEIHPDHNNSPEAAEAFMRIKQARDELLKKANKAASPDDIKASTARAVRTASAQAFTQPVAAQPSADDIAREQALDQAAATTKRHFSLFRRSKNPESLAIKRHRHNIKVSNRRLDGKY